MWVCVVLLCVADKRPEKQTKQVCCAGSPSRSPTPLFWRNVVLPKPYHTVGDQKERWHESFPKWQSLFQYSHTTEWGKLFTQNIKYKKYNTIYLYIIMFLLVSIKCWQRDGERDWEGVLGRKYYALGNTQNHFMTSLLRDEEGETQLLGLSLGQWHKGTFPLL